MIKIDELKIVFVCPWDSCKVWISVFLWRWPVLRSS